MAEEKEKKQTTVRIDQDLLKTVHKKAFERESSLTEAVDKGLRWWLGEDAPAADPLTAELTSSQTKIVTRLADLLKSGRMDSDLERAISLLVTSEYKRING